MWMGQFEVKIEIHFHSIPGLNPLSASSSIPPSKRQKTSTSNGHSHLESNNNNKNKINLIEEEEEI